MAQASFYVIINFDEVDEIKTSELWLLNSFCRKSPSIPLYKGGLFIPLFGKEGQGEILLLSFELQNGIGLPVRYAMQLQVAINLPFPSVT